jgi:hypothetical protein
MASTRLLILVAPVWLLASASCDSGASTVSTCATKAIPDFSAQGGFDIDTGLTPADAGSSYGQASCAGQYLVEVDLSAASFQGRSQFTASGFWSSTLPARPCDERSTMNVFVSSGTNWMEWDVVKYRAESAGDFCMPRAQSHTDQASAGLDVSSIPMAKGFTRARIAVNASEGSSNTALAIAGQIL